MRRRVLAFASLLCAVFVLAACEKEAPVVAATAKPSSVSDTAGWKKYVTEIVKSYIPAGKNARPYVTFAEGNQDADKTVRQVENTRNFLIRGVAEGTLLVFAAPDSALMASIVEQAFAEPKADKLKGSKVLFIGNATDQERVRAAVTPWGPEFVFHEMQ